MAAETATAPAAEAATAGASDDHPASTSAPTADPTHLPSHRKRRSYTSKLPTASGAGYSYRGANNSDSGVSEPLPIKKARIATHWHRCVRGDG
ncbi:hypothetical protein HYH02_013057 [Chlamydomonas schloesseri]|uniref:Uncharacterized protein n=1 Tax=Chlamydomonas schloesseri TaxID=2026947 RepID=A0A835SSH9_9CHLO|nr:hypothetical protein HYH02_013057 [Chlamydomonas schloesseri]|eukprot:KAG2432338.1 hypothetical protein HYH02_013057 [Chlamydomonas schloesseri]